MWHSLEAILTVTIFFTCAECSAARKKSLAEMWNKIKTRDKALYRRLRNRSYATAVNYLPWKMRGAVMRKAYFYLCKKIKCG